MLAGFWIDPLSTLKPDKDTSLLFMQEAGHREMEIFCFETSGIHFEGKLRARGHTISVNLDQEPVYRILEEKTLDFADLDLCFIRKDPPVDLSYFAVLQLMAVEEAEGRTFFINSPRSLLVANEKLYTLGQPEDLPPTFVGSSKKLSEGFSRTGTPQKVVKPLNDAGSRGVTREDEASLPSRLEKAEEEGFFLMQDFMPEVQKGDRRVFLLEDRIVGVISRVPQEGEFRCALGLGAELHIPELTDRQKEVCQRLLQRMQRDGILFAGADLIQDRLIEVNVTSPTLIRQFNQMGGYRLEKDIFDVILQKAGRRREQGL